MHNAIRLEYTFLSWAAVNGHVEVVKALLHAGANSIINNHGDLALVTQNEHIDVVRALIEVEVNPNAFSYNHSQPLAQAAGSGREKIVEILSDITKISLDKNMVDITKDPVGGEALRSAASKGP